MASFSQSLMPGVKRLRLIIKWFIMVKETKRETRRKKIRDLKGYDGGPGPTVGTSAEIFVECVEELIDSIDNNSQTSGKLSKRIFWLNVVLTFATVILASIAGFELYLKLSNA